MTTDKKFDNTPRQPTLREWMVDRGAFGFGTLFALFTLLRSIRGGQHLEWDVVKWDVAIKVLVIGPLWGLTMWFVMPRLNAWLLRRKTR